MKKAALVFLALVLSFSCHKKEDPAPEPEPVVKPATPEVFTWCIYVTENGREVFLECITGTTDEMVQKMISYQNRNIQVTRQVKKTTCSMC